MSAIAGIVSKLEKYSELSFRRDGHTITIEPADPNGFAVWLSERDGGYTVGFEGWHEEFDSEEAALNCLAFGLSDKCRLKIEYRGSFPYRWSVEGAAGDDWVTDSTTGLLFFPFWRRRHTVYWQNRGLLGRRASASGVRGPTNRRATMKWRRPKTWFAIGFIVVGGLAALVGYQRQSSREIEAFQRSVASVGIGIAASDAERKLGGPPDRISRESGFISEHFTLLPATNSQSAGLGEPQEYELRVWERGSNLGAIVVDKDGRVAGKHLVRPMPNSRTPVLWRVREWCRKMLPF